MANDVRQLQCALTPEEIDIKGRLLARKISEREAADEERKSAAKRAGDAIKVADEEIAKLAEAVNTGKEKRPIVVSDRHDNRRFCVETIRHDTLAVIETRAMNREEAEKAQQPTLFDERATADSRDDTPAEPAHAPAPAEAGQVIPGPFAQGAAATGEPGCTCGSTTDGVHEDACASLQGQAAAPPLPPGAEVTDPGGLLSGKPDGTA
jgi:hypothetical protein